MANYEITDLVEWDNRIREKAAAFAMAVTLASTRVSDFGSLFPVSLSQLVTRIVPG